MDFFFPAISGGQKDWNATGGFVLKPPVPGDGFALFLPGLGRRRAGWGDGYHP